MPNSHQCTTLSEAAACADTLAGCSDTDGRLIGFAIRVALAAIRSHHECAFVEMLTRLNDHYSLCEGHQQHVPERSGH